MKPFEDFLGWRLRSSLVMAGVPICLSTGCLELREQDQEQQVDECSSCHGGILEAPFSSAPPLNLKGDQERSARGNGAHEAHLFLSDSARPVTCEECHSVPEELHSKGHVDSPYPAEVIFRGPAEAFKATPYFNAKTDSCENTFCHGGYFVGGRPSGGFLTEPQWTNTDAQAGACGACHGLPPPLPHPEEEVCNDCHKNLRVDGSFSHPELHVDGLVTFYIPSED